MRTNQMLSAVSRNQAASNAATWWSAGAINVTLCGGSTIFPLKQIQYEHADQCQHDETAERSQQCRYGWQNEHVHPDVVSEHGIGDPKRRAVNELKEFHPASRGAEREQERENYRQRNGDLGQGRRDVHRRQLGTHAPEDRNLRRTASRDADVQCKEPQAMRPVTTNSPIFVVSSVVKTV